MNSHTRATHFTRIVPVVLIAGAAALFVHALSAAPTEIRGSRTVDLTYRGEMQVPEGDAGPARLWMPVPPSTPHQRVEDLRLRSNGAVHLRSDREQGNIAAVAELPEGASGELSLELTARVTRRAYEVELAEAPEHPLGKPRSLGQFLQPATMIPLGGKVAAEAAKVVQPEMTAAQKGRAMYDYLARSMEYNKAEPGWGKGDALRACDIRKGNCTDFHSLFIGMARTSGVPARFHIGFPLPPERSEGRVEGYHCWAEFHARGVGWVPVDISEASKDPSRHEELFAGLDADRVKFTAGRDIQFEGEGAPPALNFFIYPVGTIGAEQAEDVTWTLHFRDVED